MVNYNITISPFNVSDLVPTNSEDIIPVIVDTTVKTSDGMFGLGVLILIFLVLVLTLTRSDDFYRLDFTRSTLVSGSLCLILGLLFLAGNLISNFRHIVWFGMIFLISLFGSYYLKRKGK